MSDANTFVYETSLEWSGEKNGKLMGSGVPGIPVGAPPEFHGREGSWSPEQLLVGSVNTCLMLTFLTIAENSKISLIKFTSAANGKLEKCAPGGYQVTEVIVKPRVVVSSPEDVRRVPRILEKAKEGCFISNSIKAIVKLEPEILQG